MFLKHWCWHYSTVRCGYSHQLLPYSSGATWNFAVMNSTVHSSFMPMCKLAFQMLLNISLVTVTSFFLYAVLHLLPCFHLFPPSVLPFESSSVMLRCVLLSHTLSLLSYFFVPCLTENFSSWVFHGAAARMLEQEVGCGFSVGESIWGRKGTARCVLHCMKTHGQCIPCSAWEGKLLKEEDHIVKSQNCDSGNGFSLLLG